MPKFDYQCRKCDHVFEREHHIGEEPKVRCPVCRGGAKKLISHVGVMFKGSGFYCTDNRKTGGNGSSTNGKTVDISKDSETKAKKSSTKDDD